MGFGRAGAHFGELLQGAFRLDGGVRRGLVTLPMPDLFSRAMFAMEAGEGLEVISAGRSQRSLLKVRRAAAECLTRWTGNERGGTLSLAGNIPAGRGMGSSTSEIVATVRAVADASGVELSAGEVAEITARCESASDPLMFEDAAGCIGPVLFEQRRGRILVKLGGRLPAFTVVGFDPGGPGLSTDDLEPPECTEAEVGVFGGLLGEFGEAVRRGDAGRVGRVATASAEINQRYRPKPDFEEVVALGSECGAVGVSVAHSGTVMGLLFDPDREETWLGAVAAANHLRGLGYRVWRFGTEQRIG